jgi:hypothetical protein
VGAFAVAPQVPPGRHTNPLLQSSTEAHAVAHAPFTLHLYGVQSWVAPLAATDV